MSTAKIRNQHPTGIRALGSLPRTGLQLSQFLTRISNKRSREIRVYSFQSRKPLPSTTKMGDLPLKMSIQIWSEDLAKAIEDGLKSRHMKSADKDEAKDYKVFFIRHISFWEFFDSCETDRAQQDRRIQQLSDEVNNLRTRLENLERAQRHAMKEEGYLIIWGQNFLPSALLRKGARPALLGLRVADPWRSKCLRCTTLRRREPFGIFIHNSFVLQFQWPMFLDCGFLLFFWLPLHVATLQLDIFVYNCVWQYYSGAAFRTEAPSSSVYKCMQPHGSSWWNVRVLEETSQRIALGNRLKGR